VNAEQIIARVLELLGRDWADLVIAELTRRYPEGDYYLALCADDPRVYEVNFTFTPEYIMELIGVPQ